MSSELVSYKDFQSRKMCEGGEIAALNLIQRIQPILLELTYIIVLHVIQVSSCFYFKCYIKMFYLNSTLNFGILPVLVFQLEVYYKVDGLLTGLTAQQKGTIARWYSNKHL